MGINMNEAFPSKWLKADDVPGKVLVTIKGVSMESVGDEETKPVVWFNEFAKGVVLNKTNANNISSLYGPDTDHWYGKQMELTTAMVDFQGRSMRALRLYPPEKREFVSGTPQGGQSPNAPLNQGDGPRDDWAPPASADDYGAVRG